MTELSALLSKALRRIPACDPYWEGIVLAAWRPAVGEALGRRTRPVRLHKSTLIVAVPSVMWQRGLHQVREEILDKLQGAMGRKVVTSLEFRLDPEFDRGQDETRRDVPVSVKRRMDLDLPLEEIRDTELGQVLAATVLSYFNRPRRKQD